MMLIGVGYIASAPHFDELCIGFVQHETRDIIVPLKLVPKAVVLIVDVFFHYGVLRM